MDSNPGWSVAGQWAFGQPTGQGGAQHGHPDPLNGATGTNVYGVNLNGDYSTTVGGPYYLTMGPVSLRHYAYTILRFQRWLNSDYAPYATANVQVSSNGSNWTEVWSNGTTETADAAWTLQQYDISATADDQPAVYVRWGYQIGSGAYPYSGWNIDDVQLVGMPLVTPGDLDCDGAITFGDINAFVLALGGYAGYHAAYPACLWLNADCDGNGAVDFGDINAFVALLNP
jgi:hypothetical protein